MASLLTLRYFFPPVSVPLSSPPPPNFNAEKGADILRLFLLNPSPSVSVRALLSPSKLFGFISIFLGLPSKLFGFAAGRLALLAGGLPIGLAIGVAFILGVEIGTGAPMDSLRCSEL